MLYPKFVIDSEVYVLEKHCHASICRLVGDVGMLFKISYRHNNWLFYIFQRRSNFKFARAFWLFNLFIDSDCVFLARTTSQYSSSGYFTDNKLIIVFMCVGRLYFVLVILHVIVAVTVEVEFSLDWLVV